LAIGLDLPTFEFSRDSCGVRINRWQSIQGGFRRPISQAFLTMNNDQLSDAKQKIERANTNILDVQAQIIKFFSEPPPHYRVFRQLSADGSKEALKIKIIREPTGQIAATVGDAVTNLRSALDFLMCELAIKNKRNDLSGVEFPFADSREKFLLPYTQKKIQKLSPEAIDLVCNQQPYKGGNDLLWSLNAIRRPNIHRHLVVAAITINRTAGHMRIEPGIGFHTIEQATPWLPSDREITVITFPPKAKLDYNLQVEMDLAIHDIEPIENQSIVAVLQQFSGLTSHILTKFEERFFI
jgi:hypothetical protein